MDKQAIITKYIINAGNNIKTRNFNGNYNYKVND